ncbi:hypothetical protein R5W24_002335 [Gemmata sp. JC717]|uniref:hypothetical protein n=1 Tax=Gemmata algarum TaxID=2975278 RepID=UPI0021BB4711|nr:hypothetical protein [Gemmata algarum]MDY3553241.1 hypothetical protein [Gemmata algarum]
MPDRATVLAALAEYVNRPTTAHDIRTEPGDIFSAPPFPQLVRFLPSLLTKEEWDTFVPEMASLLRAGDPFRVSALALNCGSLVEQGVPAALVAPHLLAALPRHLALARRAAGATFDADPDALRARSGLTFLLLATMAVLCRGAAFRQAARANPDIVTGVESLRKEHREADFVAQVLGFVDGVELLVLVPDEGKGFRVALEAVNTNGHLFTLLQAALLGGGHLTGEALDDAVVAVATGERPHEELLTDHARFNFAPWYADPADGVSSLVALPVEGSPSDIPQLDGQRVVLLGPPAFASRSWDSNFFANIHDALRSRVTVVEVLPPERVAAWLDRIRQAAR